MASRSPRKSPLTLRGFLIITLLLIFSVGCLLFSFYLIALDKEIRTRFAGARWALPAQVYATPLELYSGSTLNAKTLRHELQRLGYRASDELEGPGTFIDLPGRMDIATRGFQFWDARQPPLKISVSLTPQGITGIRDLEADAPRDILRLDPMLIGSIYPQQGEDRVLLRLDEVPELFKNGLIAVEDRSFHSHVGISLKGILRAMVANMQAGKTVQGASTITQQLVKNFFLTSRRDLSRKIKEMFMAMLLEAHYSKDEILEAYLNEIWLGQDGKRAVHGYGLGSQFYFNKPVSELRAHEIALLVGIVKGPSEYNPRRNPKRALERRNLVLDIFFKEGLISELEHAEARDEPLGIAGGKQGGTERYPAFVDLVKRQLKSQYQEDDLTNEGLRIFSTLDPRTQEALETAITSGVADIEKQRKLKEDTLESSGVITSVDGGEVLALVGGRHVRYAGFNRALDMQRAIGSLAKPFVYLAAYIQADRYNLHTILNDEPIELKMPNRSIWRPGNYDKQLHGPMPAYQALAQSYNLPTVQLGLAVGEKEVRKTLVAAGYSGNAPALPSMFLGAVDIAPLEVAQMYGTLAAGGYKAPLSAIREVLTKEGEPLSRFPLKVQQTLPEAPVYLLTWSLQQVMNIGTGRSAYNLIPPTTALAGKTGTTDDYRDSWFAGYGADRVGVIWVGRDDYKPTGLSGSNGALPIWTRAMRDIQIRGLDPIAPADVEMQLTDPVTGLKADEDCAGAFELPFVRGYAPSEFAPCAGGANLAPEWLRNIFQ